MQTKKRYVVIDLLNFKVHTKSSKEAVADFIGVHRNTIKLKENRAVVKTWLIACVRDNE